MKKFAVAVLAVLSIGLVAYPGFYFGFEHGFPTNDAEFSIGWRNIQSSGFTVDGKVVDLWTLPAPYLGIVFEGGISRMDVEAEAWFETNPFLFWGGGVYAADVGGKLEFTFYITDVAPAFKVYAGTNLDYVVPLSILTLNGFVGFDLEF